MSAARGEPSGVQWNEIANVVGYQHPASLVRRPQLPVVIDATQSELICSFGVNPVLLERLRQRVSLAILVQVNPDSAHGVLCGRDGCGLRGLSVEAIFALNFAGDLLQVR